MLFLYDCRNIVLAFAIFLFGLGHPAIAYDCVAQVTTASSSITETEFKALKKKAYETLEGGNWEQAVVEYSELISHAPDDGFKYRMRGLAYALLGEWDKALCDAEKFIEFNPEHQNAFTERASYFMEMGEFEKALADYHEALARHPVEGLGINASIARALIGLGRCSEALASAEKARESDPTDEYYKSFVAEIKSAGNNCRTAFACKLTSSGDCIDVPDAANDRDGAGYKDDRDGEFKP